MENPERTCENCKYFIQHYGKFRTKFQTVGCGHCIHEKVRNFRVRMTGGCAYWERMEIQREARRRSIEEAIIAMSEQLDSIAMVLKSDREEGMTGEAKPQR